MTYQGWKNEETWAVWVWLNNTRDVYMRLLEAFALSPEGHDRGQTLEFFVREEIHGTQRQKDWSMLGVVDWQGLGEAFAPHISSNELSHRDARHSSS